MLTLVGITLILIGAAGFIWNRINKETIDANNQILSAIAESDRLNDAGQEIPRSIRRDANRSIKKVHAFPIPLSSWLYIGIGVAALMLNGLFFYANAGTAYAVQYPWGGDKAVKTQGVKMKFWGRTIPMSYEMSVQDVIIPEGYELQESNDGIYNRPASRWEFADAIKADIAISVIVGIDINDDEVFLNMADRNRSEAKLIYGRVLPNIDAALKNTCKLMDAQDYISGESSTFDRYFKDQLEYGMYMVEEYYDEEQMQEIIGDTSTIRTVGEPKTNKQKRFRIRYDSQGNIMRDTKSNTLTQYGIKILQAQVTGIDWEGSFDKRLDEQKTEVAKTQLEKQEAERQYYTMQKEIAKGEAAKAAERALLEKQQIKETVAAQTLALVATQTLIAEKQQYEVEKFKAKSKKVAADATYYENLKRVQAGLTPQERVKLEIQLNKDKWMYLKDIKLPEVYISGSDSKNGNDLLQSLIGADLAKGMKSNKK